MLWLQALAHVLEHAKVVDSEGDVVDLGALDPTDLPIADIGEFEEIDDDHEGHDHDDHEGHDHG